MCLGLLPLLSKANARKLEEERDELKGSMANNQDAAELKVAKEKNATLVCVEHVYAFVNIIHLIFTITHNSITINI